MKFIWVGGGGVYICEGAREAESNELTNKSYTRSRGSGCEKNFLIKEGEIK